MAYDKQLTSKAENLSEWYNKVVLQAELADYGLAKGTMVYRPYGYAIWEHIQARLDSKFKEYGVENAYFPLFIPESLINREKDHIEGFAPELAVVTIGGGKELEERLIVRPTSETVMADTFAKWISSWRDLPLLINQWNNVVRWEKRTYLFLRTTEFLWQEGHTAHATHDEALATQKWAMDTYSALFRDYFAIPGYVGYKSASERFAGADSSLTYEALMPGGKALQSCTSHDLGQHFSKSFEIKFQSKEGDSQYVWQTSWGLSTRSIGGLIMVHGDDKGLRLPPKLAPIQLVLLGIRPDDTVNAQISEFSTQLKSAGIRIKIDDRDDETIGRRINKWELKGVPLRLELGQRELSEGMVKLVRRDTGEAIMVPQAELVETVQALLESIQANLYEQAKVFLEANTHILTTYAELKALMEGEKGFAKVFWCGDPACEAAIKEETTATTRCSVLGTENEEGTCIYCGKPAKGQWYFGQSY